ncbi:MAG: cell division ATP-binding protein FtsE [Armatimonadota bacterium]|nr:cell division ATP-binding protein FtsE [Armatimonadota bacterium]MDR7427190.1 cell division ATP-binding protein FtsE [Armatimonadota bacterium]MDR7471091.1 cell division ATP-binding protein FtsE [Armatimonadota bacterium]MDR7473527.1 cell division ATP-binding protein FtsE [Armatimonadota bacterium]
MIRLQGVVKRYPNGLLALNDISLSVAEGEFVFLIGPTGAGKSTLLRLLYRAEVPTRGRITVGGRDVTSLPARQVPALRRSMGIVFQDFKLLPRKTAYENVAFALQVTSTPPEEIRPRAMQALEVVGLADRAGALPWQLSGGEQQRVSIARAIVHRPPLLLADEPTGNLDPRTSWEIIQLLSRINLRGTTVLVATHNRLVVDILRKRVIELAGGSLVRDEDYGLYASQA